jgi:hypothetical protein
MSWEEYTWERGGDLSFDGTISFYVPTLGLLDGSTAQWSVTAPTWVVSRTTVAMDMPGNGPFRSHLFVREDWLRERLTALKRVLVICLFGERRVIREGGGVYRSVRQLAILGDGELQFGTPRLSKRD